MTPSRQGKSRPLRLEWQIQGLGSITQSTHLLLTNPLTATVLPMGANQLTVVLQNPAGTALNGRATLTNLQGLKANTPSQPIRFAPGGNPEISQIQSQSDSKYLSSRIRGDRRGKSAYLPTSEVQGRD
ncbi:hypothetical protein [Acaryochloris sp. 'Moss Beach']|uniref:hypothetical protein n=1 Tax=Acaryochloris sp. 'Moss Beach' TaxID=2740837 RepID=UPI001F21FCB0|nr:hypothetical protein [Acaryochloris sp. 'Moss Beach']